MQATVLTPLGARPRRAFFIQSIKRLFLWRPTPRPPDISARIARDIGIGPAELERMNMRWPSNEVQHPYW
ncbi:MAG: hypothetical protein ABJN14_08270 [Paracoccaceae bacterium]